jgi:hypothetical protein
VAASPVGIPEGGEGTAEAKQGVLNGGKWQILGADLEGENNNLYIEEEVELDGLYREIDRLGTALEGEAGNCDIVALKDPDGGFPRSPLRSPRLAVQAALHIG